MGDGNIVELEGEDLGLFLCRMQDVIEIDPSRLTVWIDDVDGGVKLKVGNGTWTAHMGRVVQ